MQYLPTYKKVIIFIVLLLTLAIATPALADYLGPNRVVTQTVAVCNVNLYECKLVDGKYKDKKVEDWSCSNESKPWQAYPSNGSCHAGDEGRKHWERDEGTETITTTYPEATISGAVNNCTLQNGWCNGTSAPQLDLSATEPVAGQHILLIEGTLHGTINNTFFACPDAATSCTLPLAEGHTSYNFWAISSWGDSSRMGGVNARVDTVSPDVGMDISGVSGTNGWFVSPTTITATGSDATSGIASAVLSIDNATWQPALTLNEGIYNLIAIATDNAGNSTTSETTLVGVDTTTPSINMSITGTMGRDDWYKSTTQISAIPSDATSGIATFDVAVDGGAYQTYTPTAFRDGLHTIQFRAIDNAGNQTETGVQAFAVDTTPPTVELPGSWQLGRNVPYSVWDEGSGLRAVRIVIEDEDERYAKVTWDADVSGKHYSQDIDWNGEFRDKTVAPPGTYLVWIKASDKAGNERFQLGKIIVPEPNVFLDLLPTEAPSAVEPVPPAELSDPDAAAEATAVPAVGFGGSTTQPGEATTQSFLLAVGSAGAVSTTTTPGILWGVAAAAAIAAATAYALDVAQKRREAEEAQAERVEAEVAQDKARRAENRLTKEEKHQLSEEHDEKVKDRKEQQEWENPAKEKALIKAQQERDQAYQEQLQQQQLEDQQVVSSPPAGFSLEALTISVHDGVSAQDNMTQQAPVTLEDEKKQALQEWAENKKAEADQVAASMAAAKQAEQLASLPGYFASEKQAEPSQPANWWDKITTFVQDKIIEPVVTTVIDTTTKTVDVVNEKVIQPYIAPVIEKATEIVQNDIAWINENVVEPYVKPYVEEQIEDAKELIQVVNEKIVQPYIAPAVTTITEQSWLQDALEEAKDIREKVILWVDEHQTEIALGVGVAVGIAAIILSGGLAAPLVAAAWVAGAAAAAAGIMAVETVALNIYFEREWNENLLRNMALAGLPAAAITGAWFLFQAATAAIAPFCYTHQEICGRIEPVLNTLDWGEEAWLSTKLAYQTWIGDDVGATETALELQTEQMDGGLPGNSVLKELGEETAEKVAKYGDEALSLVMLYGDDAAEIIATYGDDGVALLMKYGDDAIDLIQDHGLTAIKVIQAVDLEHAEDLLEVLDDDVLDYVTQQGPDAIDALSRWSTEDLSKYGPELALRAEKDGKVLAAVKKLVSAGPIDPKHLTEEQQELLNVIAANSTQYSDEGQVVLGKWVDQGSGFVEVAQDTGSAHYNPHPDMWEMLGDLGEENQDEVAWLINKQVVQNGIDKGLPFEYTLNGIPDDIVDNEQAAVRAIFSGKTDAEIMDTLQLKYMPIRMKELQELQKAGYEPVFDEVTNSYVLILP